MNKKLISILISTVFVLLFVSACAKQPQSQESIAKNLDFLNQNGITVEETQENIPIRYSALVKDFDLGVTVYAFTNTNGNVEFRVYGNKQGNNRGFYDLTIEDDVITDVSSLPVSLMDERFGSCKPVAYKQKIDGYQADDIKTGIFQALSSQTQPQYIIYGTFGDTSEARFYPASEEKKMIPGALPVEIEGTKQSKQEREVIDDVNQDIENLLSANH